MSRHLVFLYGTLKKGQPNEYLIKDLKDVKYIGRAVTCQAYPLIIRAEWRLPHLLKVEGKGKNIKGEVIEVDDVGLERLDVFEEHPTWYNRQLTEVELIPPNECESVMAEQASRLSCWVYFSTHYEEEELTFPCHEDYNSYGDHGLEYDISENEDHPSNKKPL